MLTQPHPTETFGHDHVALTVRDLQVSGDFYAYLGGRIVSQPSTAFMEIVLGEIRLHLLPAASEEEITSTPRTSRIDHLCLRVSSVEALHAVRARLIAHPRLGGRCEIEDSPPFGQGGAAHVEEHPPRKTLYFEDPDGIRLEIRAYA